VVIALLSLFVTVLTGVVVLGLWFGPDKDRRSGQRVSLGIAHAAIAVAGTILWMIFALGRDNEVGLVSIILLAGAVLIGVATVVSTHRRAAGPHSQAGKADADAVPVPILIVHTVLAAVAFGSALAVVLSR
jgi:hypothetical protein